MTTCSVDGGVVCFPPSWQAGQVGIARTNSRAVIRWTEACVLVAGVLAVTIFMDLVWLRKWGAVVHGAGFMAFLGWPGRSATSPVQIQEPGRKARLHVHQHSVQ